LTGGSALELDCPFAGVDEAVTGAQVFEPCPARRRFYVPVLEAPAEQRAGVQVEQVLTETWQPDGLGDRMRAPASHMVYGGP